MSAPAGEQAPGRASREQRTILLLSGPNLGLLGERQPEIYGSETLADHVERARQAATRVGYELKHLQSEHEADLVAAVHEARGKDRRDRRQRGSTLALELGAARRPGLLRRAWSSSSTFPTRTPANRGGAGRCWRRWPTERSPASAGSATSSPSRPPPGLPPGAARRRPAPSISPMPSTRERSPLAPMDVAARLPTLAGRLGELGCDGLLVTKLSNIRYLTGFTGSAGLLLVLADDALLVTDGRYRDQSAEQVKALRRAGADRDRPARPPSSRPSSSWQVACDASASRPTTSPGALSSVSGPSSPRARSWSLSAARSRRCAS